jgi:hypothetical protein
MALIVGHTPDGDVHAYAAPAGGEADSNTTNTPDAIARHSANELKRSLKLRDICPI